MTPTWLRRRPRAAAWLCAAVLVGACGSSAGDDVTQARYDQARVAALDAGLSDDVADFLGAAASGATATHRVSYGTDARTEVVIHQQGENRRIDVLSAGRVTDVSIVTGGQAFACSVDNDDTLERCTRTDAIVDGPGVFRPAAISALVESLVKGKDSFTFSVSTRTLVGVEARCLTTRRRAGVDDPALTIEATFCISPSGVPLLVDQGGDQLRAVDYSDTVVDGIFDRPGD